MSLAQAAVARLVRGNPPGKVSLAGAYALGYGVLGLAQSAGEEQPLWLHELDPLDTLFLGSVWPRRFRDGYEFANALMAWLRLLRGSVHWNAMERFVREVLAASAEHDLPVDEGELMLLLAGRLEAAGLDQRKLPRSMLPGTALAGTRLARGPAVDAALPDPPPDAADRVARLWASTQIGLPDDGTAADALREGLHLLAAAGLDARHDAIMLLPALYIGLVAGEYEDLAGAGERAAAWALGLDGRSSLVPVTDLLLTAPQRGLDPDTALGHLFGVPAFTAPVQAEDRAWHSWPGTALTGLAFELGYTQVTTRDGKVVRVDPDQMAALDAQCRQFEEKFGRPPGPDDPLFFDPDADQPQPVSPLGLEAATAGMLETAGICPAWVYAYQHTGGLLPLPDGSFASARDQADWNEAISRYLSTHQPGGQVDHQAETRKLRNITISMTLAMAADDPGYGEALAGQLTVGGGRAPTPPCCASTCAPERTSSAGRCAATASFSRRQGSTPERGAEPAWPAAWKPLPAAAPAAVSLMTFFSPRRSPCSSTSVISDRQEHDHGYSQPVSWAERKTSPTPCFTRSVIRSTTRSRPPSRSAERPVT